jgi:hypothetical protein
VDIWDVTRLMVRRWYFSLPVILLCAFASVVTIKEVKPDYSSIGYLQLVPPSITPDEAGKLGRARNPWVDLGVDSLGDAAMVQVRSQDTLDQLVAGGYTDNFTVSMDGRSPIIMIQSIGTSPAQATGSTRQILQLLTSDIGQKQRVYGVGQDEAITTLTLGDGGYVTKVNTKVKRALIVVAGVGLLLAVAATVAGDALIRRRRRRRVVPHVEPRVAVTAVGAGTMTGTASAPTLNQDRLRGGLSGAGRDGSSVPSPRAEPASPVNGHPKVAEPAPAIAVEYGTPARRSTRTEARPEAEAEPDDSAVLPTGLDSTIVLPLAHTARPGREDKNTRR